MLSTILILLLCVSIMGQSSVQVLNATVGDSILIPCSLPAHPVNLKQFFWQEDESPNILFHWENGQKQDKPKPGYTKYRGRCRAFDTEFNSGNISIRLDNVTVGDDQQTFWAYAWNYDEQKEQKVKICEECCRSRLQVSAPYKDLVLTVNRTANRAACRAHGGYPEPQVSWTGRNKSSGAQQDLQDAETSMQEDPTEETFSVSSSVSVEELQSVTCIIYNPRSNESTEKTEWIDGSGEGTPGWLIGISVVIIIIVIIVIIIFVYRYRSNGNCNQQQRGDGAAAGGDGGDGAAAAAALLGSKNGDKTNTSEGRKSPQPTELEMEEMNPDGQGLSGNPAASHRSPSRRARGADSLTNDDTPASSALLGSKNGDETNASEREKDK